MSRFKTELCNNLIELGICKYGDRCHYAHGAHELRQVSRRHPKYRTEKCKNFELTGKCPFGPRCSYVHPKPDLDSMIEQLTRYLKHTTAPKPDFEDHGKEHEKVVQATSPLLRAHKPLSDTSNLHHHQQQVNQAIVRPLNKLHNHHLNHNHYHNENRIQKSESDLKDQENQHPNHPSLIKPDPLLVKLEQPHSSYSNANPKRVASKPFGISRKPLSDMLNINTHQVDCCSPLKKLTNRITSHTISDTSKQPINRTNEYYRKSFIEFLLDPKLTGILHPSDVAHNNLANAKSTPKLIEAPLKKRSATVCALLSNFFSANQVRFCQRHHDLLESILPQIIQIAEKQCNTITKDLEWNCSIIKPLFDKSSSLAYTREAALVRSVLSASMTYLVAKLCSENGHGSCGCLSSHEKPTRIELVSMKDAASTADLLDARRDHPSFRPPRAILELSLSDLSKLSSGSPIHLDHSLEQRQGCVINSAFANAFTKVFIDSEETKSMNKAYKILNNESARSQGSRDSNLRRIADDDDKNLAHIRWTKSAINLHNNQIGRKIVREATLKRCRCHGLSGSCQLQTCWEQLLDFGTIASRLKNIYLERSVKTFTKNLGSQERPDLYLMKVAQNEDRLSSPNLLLNHGGDLNLQTSEIRSDELLYIYDSPDYCEPQPRLGHHGTRGRACIPSNNVTIGYSKRVARTMSVEDESRKGFDFTGDGQGPGTCERLCCNRGYQRELILDVVPCNCRFKFCCRIECEDCLRQIEQYYCL